MSAHTVEPGSAADPGERGSTTINATVVERIAAQAITELEHVGGTSGQMFGLPARDDGPQQSAKASARVAGDTATLRLRISVVYPVSVGEATERTREHVRGRVSGLTGLTVSRVDITVAALHTGKGNRRLA